MKRHLVLLVLFPAIACNEKNEIVDPGYTQISLSVHNLPPLEAGHYQLWAKFLIFSKTAGITLPQHDDGFQSLGEFNVREGDHALIAPNGRPARFALPQGRDPQLLFEVAIAVQPPDEGLEKAQHEEVGPILIAGQVRGDAKIAVADLSIGHDDALHALFSTVTGVCTIAAPTSPGDSNSGVWFVAPGAPVIAGLKNLPSLHGQWLYEGWVVRRGIGTGGFTYVSTGKFARADSADLDGPGLGAGSGTPWNFPGQDFVLGASRIPNLLDGEYGFMVTIEPLHDNSAGPFFMQILKAETVTGPARTFAMQNNVVNVIPTARVVIAR